MTTFRLSNGERTKTVQADNSREAIAKVDFYPTKIEALLIIDELKTDIKEIESRINDEYWRFTRCAKANPPRAELVTAKHEIELQIFNILYPA